MKCMASGCLKAGTTSAIIGDTKWPLCKDCAKRAASWFQTFENRRKIFDD